MNMLLAVFLGSGLGGAARYGFMSLESRLIPASAAYATLGVNVLGCLAIGMLIEFFAQQSSVPATLQAFLTVGFLGGFTTFSSFSVEVLRLYQTGDIAGAALYAGASLVLSLAAVFLGLYFMRWVLA